MLKWLAQKFEQKRAGLQARLEISVARGATSQPASSDDPAGWRKRGNLALDAGNLSDAAHCYQQALDLTPTAAGAWVNLGFVKFEQKLYAEALPLMTQALELDPENVDAWYILGGINRSLEDWQGAEKAYRRAIQIKPDFEMAYLDLCRMLLQHSHLDAAEACLQNALRAHPGHTEFANALGQLLLQQGRTLEAAVCYKRAAQIKPLDRASLNNLGLALHRLGDVYAAVAVFQEAAMLAPENAQVLCNLGGSFQISGDLKAAAESYRAALNVDPGYIDAHQNLLYALSFMADAQPHEYLAAAREFGACVAAKAKQFSEWTESNAGLDGRPLRIGLVSGDLRNHAVGYFLESVVMHIRPEKLVLVAYSNSNVEDELTLRIRPFFTEWSSVAGLTDTLLAEKIHSDKIDVLIDLAGHTAGNRLAVFAWRPAPVQVSWLGYWASTGVSEVDYILVDEVSVPGNAKSMFSEKIWYLPDTRFCFTPPVVDGLDAWTPLPANRNGYVTFGSFQVLSKMSSATLSVWSKVLAEVPHSRLRLQNWQLAYPTARENLLQQLEKLGVQRDRVSMHGGSSRKEYLQAYSEVDVILDTFPFPGGTTTLEALWMGVPTVTLTGETLIARQGESILRCAGLGSWVVSSEDDYISQALEHVADLASLAVLRADLRTRVCDSPLFDAASFADAFEQALLGMRLAKAA